MPRFSALLLLVGVTLSAARNGGMPIPRWLSRLPRGGSSEEAAAEALGNATATASGDEEKMFPPLTMEEIRENLDKVPVFGICDDQGNNIVIKSESGERVIFFFLDPALAESAQETLAKQLGASAGPGGGMNLRAVPFSLGRTFTHSLTKNGLEGVTVKSAGGAEDPSANVSFRFIASPADVEMARILSVERVNATLSAIENKTGTPLDAGVREKAFAQLDARFNVTSENSPVPLFTIPQMAIMQGNETMRPWFFSLEEMLAMWKGAQGAKGEDAELNPDTELMVATLQELVQGMQKSSPADFRKCVLVPPEAATRAVQQAAAGGAGGVDALGDAVAAAAAKQNAAGGAGLFDDEGDEGGMFGSD